MKNLILLSLILLTGCATDIDYKIPSHRFMDPETRGTAIFKAELSGFYQLSYQSDHKLTMSEVYTFPVFGDQVNDGQALSDTLNLGMQAGLGILPMFDIHLRRNGDSPNMVLAKVQLLGDHANASKEGYKLALWAGVGAMEEDEGTLTITKSDGSTRTYSGAIEVHPYEVGTSFGYRMADYAMVYMNATFSRYPSKSTLTSSVNPTVVVEGDADLAAVALGFKLGKFKGVNGHFEIGASRVKWGENIKIEQDIGSAGVAISIAI
ncbi:MAG: hypothetical protein CME71_12655 [Halobacteriovorax sp.]|nr:hypothetical protein [Halobacteriovorax sp.]